MLTWGQLKAKIRGNIWPNGEASNLVPAHDQSFIDAIVDIQTWVPCQRQNNTSLIPQCATLYNCGLTVFDAPQGNILKVSVIDKLNPTTGLEDATAADDWCSEIAYSEVDICLIHAYLRASRRYGCCLPIPLFFGLSGCSKGLYPVPTDVGVPKSLPALPLGYRYPQASTDRAWGRAGAGVYAKESGKIFIAPWLQTTETAIAKWDGTKTTWADADPVSEDPKVEKAIRLYVREQHADEWDKEHEEAAIIQGKYALALADLVHQCREETRVRRCEPSLARAANNLTALFYNDDQSGAVSCPDGTTGQGVSVTIPAGTIASNISKADANQKAQAEARAQAQSRLDCMPNAVTYTNDAQTATVSCQAVEGEPPPEGVPVTRTVAAGTVTSTVSKADANTQALALAQQLASAALSCTYWNAAQSYTAVCANHSASDVTKTVPAHTFSSTVSQGDADALALNDAKKQAEAALNPSCKPGGTFYNTEQIVSFTKNCPGAPPCQVKITCIVSANRATSIISQADANTQAQNLGRQYATVRADQYCRAHECGSFTFTL